MTIKRSGSGARQIDLGGPDGNVFALMGYARNFCRQLKRDPKPITTEMMSGDYKNAVKVFESNFGSFVDIILPNGVESIEDL